MSKPEWSRAPSWAQWMAQDENGVWGWFEQRPTDYGRWESDEGPSIAAVHTDGVCPNWRDTLEARPSYEQEHECDTCGGEGTIDETLGGEHFSNPEAPCPDCDGKGFWIERKPSDEQCQHPVDEVCDNCREAYERHKAECLAAPMPGDEPTGHPHAELAGPELHRAIADEMERGGEWWREFEFYGDSSKSWLTPGKPHDLLTASIAFTIRRKPTLRTITDADGREHRFPEPMQELPKPGSDYWTIAIHHADLCHRFTYNGDGGKYDGTCEIDVARRIAHRTKENALAHAKALIAASGGETQS